MTGGASGIGEAVVRHLAACGADVTVLDRDGQGARSLADSVGGRSLTVDLSEPGLIDSLDLDADILVNNAGYQVVAPIQNFEPSDFVKMHAVMLESPFRLIKALLPGMYSRGWGRVINISLRTRTSSLAVQIGLCQRQAWARGLVQSDGA